MATFEEFIESIQADGNDGKAFEHFCKWFLLNDPYWKTQVDKAWLFSEWPDRWGPDNGVDLIFKHKNGEMWAVQAKCYDEKYSVSKKDMDSFLTESNRPVIKHRLLLASTNIMGRNAQRACTGQEKPVTLYLLKDFKATQVEYPSHISKLTSAKPKAKPIPDPHQTRAIDDVVSKFRDHDRGQLIMACGTGKTFTTLWIKEALAAQTTLVLLPSLNLLAQTLHEWAFAAKNSFDVLCVCSDKTVGKRDKEDMALGEVPFSVTSDLSVISDFISNNVHKVIFCTYQSSDLIAEVQSDKSINPFDLVIADEAHRCSGKSDAAFSKVLDSEAIRATKRLFTTATPRLYSSSLKKAAADRGIEVYGMDEETVFGPVLHTLTFGQAIAEDLLNDYQVVIVGVDQPMIKEWIENQELLGVNPNNVTDARTLAAKIGLLKTIKNYGLTRVISFHSRVNAARDFAAEVAELVDLIEPSNRPKGTLWSSYVSGAMRTTDRILEIGRLKSLESADIGVLANARCLSEGVDVPSLDGIAFIDPRGSQVDIIQAVGRAIRKVRGAAAQTKGTIVLPVFIEEGDDAEAEIEASNFKPVWDVLKALRSHDEILAEHLDRYRTNMARGSKSTHQTLGDRIIFDLPKNIDPKFSSALRTVLVEATTASWEFWFGILEEYVEEFKDPNVPKTFTTRNGYKLGSWIDKNRQARKFGNLSKQRFIKLSELGLVWDPHEQMWEQGLKELKKFLDDNGHCHVPTVFISKNGFTLGQWVANNRSRKDTLGENRITQLNNLNFVWDTTYYIWNNGLNHLKDYVGKYSNAKVPQTYKSEDGFNLGSWVSTQRTNKAALSQEQINSLNQLGFIWDPFKVQWEKGLQALKTFVKENNHAKVPTSFKSPDGFRLGGWVDKRRSRKNLLTAKQIEQLNKLNFVWQPYEEIWEQGLKNFEAYLAENSHPLVPQTFITKDGFNLGGWVATIRTSKTLTKKKKEKLNSIGFVWNARDHRWEIGFKHFKHFVTEHCHAKVPQAWKTADGFNLGLWVSRQRHRFLKLDQNQIKKLNDLGFIWENK